MPRLLRVVGSSGDGSNPFTRHLLESLHDTGEVEFRPYSKRVVGSDWPDIWHLNWPDAAYRATSVPVTAAKAAKLLAQIRWARLRGTRLVWTVHNLEPHEVRFPRIEAWFWRRFRESVDLFVHLSEAGRSCFLKQFPETEYASSHIALFHPAYPVPSEAFTERGEARRRQGMKEEAPMLVIVGRLAPYKGIPTAIEDFAQAGIDTAHLTVAGQPTDHRIEQQLKEASRQCLSVELRLRYLNPDELYEIVRAADIVLLPYRTFLNSGALLLALSLGRPVLVPATAVTKELQIIVGAKWVHTYTGRLTRQDLEDALEVETGVRDVSELPDLTSLSWERFATKLVAAYRALL